jgi:hypothetical protein
MRALVCVSGLWVPRAVSVRRCLACTCAAAVYPRRCVELDTLIAKTEKELEAFLAKKRAVDAGEATAADVSSVYNRPHAHAVRRGSGDRDVVGNGGGDVGDVGMSAAYECEPRREVVDEVVESLKLQVEVVMSATDRHVKAIDDEVALKLKEVSGRCHVAARRSPTGFLNCGAIVGQGWCVVDTRCAGVVHYLVCTMSLLSADGVDDVNVGDDVL